MKYTRNRKRNIPRSHLYIHSPKVCLHKKVSQWLNQATYKNLPKNTMTLDGLWFVYSVRLHWRTLILFCKKLTVGIKFWFRVGFRVHFASQFRDPVCLTLCKSVHAAAGSGCSYVLMCSYVCQLCCFLGPCFLVSSILCGLHQHLISSSARFSESWGQIFDGKLPFRTECFQISHFLLLCLLFRCGFIFFFFFHLLQEEASLLLSEQYTDPRVDRNVIRGYSSATFL